MAANALEFYATSAAILPVFYLTLAVEQRSSGFFSDDVASIFAAPNSRAVRAFRSIYALFVTFTIAIGEGAALIGMVIDAPLRFDSGYLGEFVLVALVVGGFGVVAPTVVVHADQMYRAVIDDSALTLPRTIFILGAMTVFVWMIFSFMWALIH